MVAPTPPADTRHADIQPGTPDVGADEVRALLVRLLRGPVAPDASGGDVEEMRRHIHALREAGVPVGEQCDGGYALTELFELLDSDAILARLPARVRARTASLELAWVLDSTNSELQRRPAAANGAASVLLAEGQSGGRGRRGKDWSSPLGAHVYLSLARTFDAGWARLGGLSLAAGVATVEALHGLGYDRVRLKWPNDLVVPAADGGLRKLGGLLVDGGGHQDGPARAVIGVGVNVRMPNCFGDRIEQPWCDLVGLRVPPPSRSAIAAAIITHWVPALDSFERSGLTPLLARYAAVDAIAGQPVRITSEAGCVDGIAVGLASDGSLRVRTEQGSERHFHAGEVSVRRIGGMT
ncbi:biotin--[acetyl-CoA-carboxylase] ligase [Lysobacter sp. H21R4]|nr:biotin--[acetyl-CoA-carboxylase] ligase [Lysobacter sp. H21R4]